jgi:hypothetical protein
MVSIPDPGHSLSIYNFPNKFPKGNPGMDTAMKIYLYRKP